MRVALIGMWIAVSGICAIAGAALPGLRPPRRAVVLGVAAAGLLVIGVVAGFSIGIALPIAAIAVVAAALTTAMRAGIGLGRQALSLMLLLAAAAVLMGIGSRDYLMAVIKGLVAVRRSLSIARDTSSGTGLRRRTARSRDMNQRTAER